MFVTIKWDDGDSVLEGTRSTTPEAASAAPFCSGDTARDLLGLEPGVPVTALTANSVHVCLRLGTGHFHIVLSAGCALEVSD